MEHTKECERQMVQGHLAEQKLTVPPNHWDWAQDQFCFCHLRPARSPKPNEIQILALKAQLWARVVRANPDLNPESAWTMCQAVAHGKFTLVQAHVITDNDRVIEVDFRKRARTN